MAGWESPNFGKKYKTAITRFVQNCPIEVNIFYPAAIKIHFVIPDLIRLKKITHATAQRRNENQAINLCGVAPLHEIFCVIEANTFYQAEMKLHFAIQGSV